METELKLRFEQSTHLMAVLDEPWFKEFLLPDESGVLRFRNRYFDTKDYKFRSKKAVVRVREVEDHPISIQLKLLRDMQMDCTRDLNGIVNVTKMNSTLCFFSVIRH